jgi:hypothetical protein
MHLDALHPGAGFLPYPKHRLAKPELLDMKILKPEQNKSTEQCKSLQRLLREHLEYLLLLE